MNKLGLTTLKIKLKRGVIWVPSEAAKATSILRTFLYEKSDAPLQ
jgi:hypothetical protein